MPGNIDFPFIWSPDGQWLIFFRYDGDAVYSKTPVEVWITKPDRSEQHLLFTGTAYSQAISWSANGEKFITNCSEGDEPDSLCIVNIEDFTVKHLGYHGISPSYSPDGELIAWIDEDEQNIMIFSEGDIEPRLIDDNARNAGELIWSKNGKDLFYISWLGSRSLGESSLFVVNVDGTSAIKLASYDKDLSLKEISPDGTQLLVLSQVNTSGITKNGDWGLINLSDYQYLTLPNTSETRVWFSPDGNHLLAQNWDNGGIYEVDRQTGVSSQTEWMKWITGTFPWSWAIQP